jgi:tRNA pseudouridine38-40 synthase
MPRYKIIIEYDGTNISGWQRQASSPSIQQFIEEAIEKFSREKTIVYGAGRTDSGVHALGQVAHFDLEKEYPTNIIQRAINHFLRPNKIAILDCSIVDNNFNARFSAKKRHYRYVILNRNVPSVFENYRAWHVREKLDIEKLQIAANILIGKHDFTSFRATHCQALSPIKTLDKIQVYKEKEHIIITLEAKSFLHHMVRNIVGSLALVGNGKWQPSDIANALEAKNRCSAGPTAPACGLYFVQVDY